MPSPQNKTCANPNCTKLHRKLYDGFCETCFNRKNKFGNPNYKEASFPLILTKEQENILIGHILGDAHISRKCTGYNASLSFTRQAKDKEYLSYSIIKLKSLFTENVINRDLQIKGKPDKRTLKTYSYVNVHSRNVEILNKFHNKWYKDKIKIVPKDLKLNDLIVAIWYLDDGWLQYKKYSYTIGLATNSFTSDDVDFLIDELKKLYGDNIYKQKSSSEKEQFTIKISSQSALKFIRAIDPLIPKCMNRKRLWTEEKLSKLEKSKRVYSYKNSVEKHHRNIVEYCNLINSFTTQEFGIKYNWTCDIDGKPTVFNKPIITYLQPYVDKGYLIHMISGNQSKTRAHTYTLTPFGKQFFQLRQQLTNLLS